MDWERVVERNAKRLQRILAALVAMAGLTIRAWTQLLSSRVLPKRVQRRRGSLWRAFRIVWRCA